MFVKQPLSVWLAHRVAPTISNTEWHPLLLVEWQPRTILFLLAESFEFNHLWHVLACIKLASKQGSILAIFFMTRPQLVFMTSIEKAWSETQEVVLIRFDDCKPM